MLSPQVKKEAVHLLRSFIGAVAAAAAIAALNWLGAEIPIALHALALVGGGYAASHTLNS